MATVHLQCGNCRMVMGILEEHLGGQVQCPHCHAVVRTPAPAASPAPPSQPSPLPDDIFAAPEPAKEASDAQPTIEFQRVEEPVSSTPPEAAHAPSPPPESSPLPDAETDLTAFKRRPVHEKSLLPVIFMIFLVPYAILTTLFIIYLLTNQKSTHPLDLLPDPKAKKGGPQQIIHNYPLAPHQLVSIGQSIQVGKDGDLVIIPEHVRFTSEWDLELVLRARNISKNFKFTPIHDFYLKYSPSKKNDGEDAKPYTYLESASKNVDTIYGGFLEFRKMVQGKEQLINVHDISPNEEELIVITTMENYRPLIEKNIAKSNDSFVWRVQLRRGMVKYEGKNISATAVIGVEFTTKQIEQPS